MDAVMTSRMSLWCLPLRSMCRPNRRICPAVVILLLLALVADGDAFAEVSASAVTSSTDDSADSRKIEPDLVYRAGALKRRENSVFFDPKTDSDYADQFHLGLNFTRSFNYTNDVAIVPAIRTPRDRPADDNIELLIEQAWVRFNLGSAVSVTAGKKTEFEGSGFIANPSDLLNEDKDIFDFLAQREGKVFTRVTGRVGNHSLGLGFIPNRGKESGAGKFWAQAGSDVLDIDIRAQYTMQREEKSTIGLSMARFFGEFIELHVDAKHQNRQHVPNNPSRLRPEAFSAYEKDDSSNFILAGTRVVLSPKRTLIVEGVQNESGLLPEEMENYFAAIATSVADGNEAPKPNSRLIGRRYGFVSYQDEDTVQRLKVAVSSLYSIQDRSAFVLGQLRYALSPITSVEFAPTFYVGESRSEFGEMPFSRAHYLIFRGRF